MFNNSHVYYFPLMEYIKKIKLSSSLLEHLEYTNCEFDNYMNELSKYDEEYIINYWIYLLYRELKSNQKIEYLSFDVKTLVSKDIFFDTLNISNKRIFDIHNFVTENELEPTFKYRSSEVKISRYDKEGNEEIFYRGSESKDVNKFMNDFINIYKHNGTSLIFSNPFLVSSLIHLIFLRIHPFTDGNGRTSRILHNIKFTETINKLYNTRLKISPLNLSESIYLNKVTYVNKIDNIYFDLEHDNYESINAWFNFMLDMADEQIYKSLNLLNDTNCIKNRDIEDISKNQISSVRKILRR